MLKKIGAITAGTTACLVGLSPAAFAAGPVDADLTGGVQVDVDEKGVFVGHGCGNDVTVQAFDTPVSVRHVAGALGLVGSIDHDNLTAGTDCTTDLQLGG